MTSLAPTTAQVTTAKKTAEDVLNMHPGWTMADYEAEMARVFNACCPFDVKFRRTLDPTVNNWAEECRGRVIGMAWKKGVARVMVEWKIGSGKVLSQASYAKECVTIYAKASGTFKNEDDIKHPNAWKDLWVCLTWCPEEDDTTNAEEEWVCLNTLLPQHVRSKVRSVMLTLAPITVLLTRVCTR